MTVVPFVRALFPPSSPHKTEAGPDIVAVKRAISRAGFWRWQEFDDVYHEAFAGAVEKFRVAHGLAHTKIYDQATHDKLRAAKAVEPNAGQPAFDATAVLLMRQAYKDLKPAEMQKAEDLYLYCLEFDGPYVWGGEHDHSFADDTPHKGFDCSSSVSFALYHVGLLGSSMAHVSSWFESWGEPGRGRFLTVHSASDHVWIEFTVPSLAWARFDTSPHGDPGVHGLPGTGPRVRHGARDTGRFVHRHPRGF